MIKIFDTEYYDRYEGGKMLNMSPYVFFTRAQKAGIISHRFGRRGYYTMQEIKKVAEWTREPGEGKKPTPPR